MQLLQQGGGVVVPIVDQAVFGKLFAEGYLARTVTIEDAPPAVMLLPEGTQLAQGIDTGKRQQTFYAVLLQEQDRLVKVLAVYQLGIVLGVDALIADEGQTEFFCH